MKLLTVAVIAALSSGSLHAADVQPYKPAPTLNPNRPAYMHEYRHGAVPTIPALGRITRWDRLHSLGPKPQTLSFGGGTGGVGVMAGQNKVYLVFYGTQWGTSSTDANGNLKFSSDSNGSAGAAQQMFKGIGTNNETWQGDLTQWCNDVSSGATSCPTNDTTRIPYQRNILAGVWYDNTKASPKTASAAQLANEAIAAAKHFGNTTVASNRSAYYVILSPKGTNPDNYQGAYCAWHDYTADAGVTSPYGDMAFSNQPYNTDSGAGCGVNFVNSGSAGTLDGFTMTLGHEWHEMMSDQFPSGGWTNQSTGNFSGQENSDECAWIDPGQAGGAANIAFGTGTFAEQASWSNDTNNCSISHADVSNSNSPPTANFSFSTSALTANFTDSSTDSDGTVASYAWTFGDGGTSSSANPSHAYSTHGFYGVTETVTDNDGATGSKTATVVVSTGASTQMLGNPGFESATYWTGSSGVICATGCSGETAHAGSGFARLGGQGTSHTDTLSQTIAVPTGKTTGTLTYYLHIDTAETTTTAKNDTLSVQLYSGSTLLKTLATFSNLNAAAGYVVRTQSVSTYLGNPNLTVRFTGKENGSLQTSFVVDDVTLTVQ